MSDKAMTLLEVVGVLEGRLMALEQIVNDEILMRRRAEAGRVSAFVEDARRLCENRGIEKHLREAARVAREDPDHQDPVSAVIGCAALLIYAERDRFRALAEQMLDDGNVCAYHDAIREILS